jgi:hypothetical protein
MKTPAGSFQGLDHEIKREHSFFKPANEQYSQPPPSFQVFSLAPYTPFVQAVQIRRHKGQLKTLKLCIHYNFVVLEYTYLPFNSFSIQLWDWASQRVTTHDIT